MDGIREKILNSAGGVFAERGYKSATIRQICQAADVNVAAVNYYFGDKQRLYLETVKQAHRRLAAQFPLPPWPEGTSSATKLKGFVHAMLSRMIGGRATPWQQQLMLREVLQPTSACRELVDEYFRPHLELLLGIIGELMPKETSAPRRQQIAFSIIGQCLFYRIAGDVVEMMVGNDDRHHFTIDHLAEHIAGFSLAAITGSSPATLSPKHLSGFNSEHDS